MRFAGSGAPGGWGVRVWRIACWAIWFAAVGLFATETIEQGGLVLGTVRGDSLGIGLALIPLAYAAALWWLARNGMPLRTSLGEVAMACFALMALCGITYYGLNFVADRAEREADQAWAAVGMPLNSTPEDVPSTEENESLRAIASDLQVYGIGSLYKGEVQSALKPLDQPSTNLNEEVLNILKQLEQPGDVSETNVAAAGASDYLTMHAEALDGLYSGVLAREAPAWSFEPEQGFNAQLPSYLALRLFTQMSSADAISRLRRGDAEGAAAAIAAAERASTHLESDPRLVSVMIRAAILALASKVEARLPEDASPVDDTSARAARMRAALIGSLRYESWALRQYATQKSGARPDLRLHEVLATSSRSFRMPVFCAKLRPVVRLAAARAGIDNAAQIEILRDVSNVDTDLGDAAFERISANWKNPMGLHLNRANQRLHGALLLGEQSDWIRSARTKLRESSFNEEAASKIVPGSKWIAVGDAVAGTATLRLEPLPPWVSPDRGVIPQEFWLVPLDGSVAWKFAPEKVASRTAAVAGVE